MAKTFGNKRSQGDACEIIHCVLYKVILYNVWP